MIWPALRAVGIFYRGMFVFYAQYAVDIWDEAHKVAESRPIAPWTDGCDE